MTSSHSTEISVAREEVGGGGESEASPLPFKKPPEWTFAYKIFDTAKGFCFRASILNMIAVRAIAAAENAAPQSDAVSWASMILSFFPIISIVSIIIAQAEFTTREWIYYRMLEHNVIIDFPSRNEHSYLSLSNSAGTLWIVGGTVLLIALMGYNADSAGLALSQWPFTEIMNVAMQAYLMITAVHEIRQMTKRLPDINTLLLPDDNREKTLAWLAQLEVMREDAVQFHFLCVSEAADAAMFAALTAASGRASISDVPNGAGAGLSNSIDFSKVGKEGLTEEKLNEIRRASRNRANSRSGDSAENRYVHGPLSMHNIYTVITGFRWASAVRSNCFEAKADAQVFQTIKKTEILCILVSLFVLVLGVTSAGELGQELSKLIQGNTTMNTTTVS